MDVSRIDGFNPNKINWKNLTAKEIMKYSHQGVEVPGVYYQWAIQFLNDVEGARNDEVTYQVAKSETRHSANKENTSKRTETGDVIATDKNTNDESETTTGTTEDTNESDEATEAAAASAGADATAQPAEPQLTAAQSKKQKMIDNGVGLRKMSLSFSADSIRSSVKALAASISMKLTESDSNSEINDLEGHMKEIMSRAKSTNAQFKEQVKNVGKQDAKPDINKLASLAQEMEKYGTDGQNMISESEGEFSGFDGELVGETPTVFNAKDFGSETVDVGNQLVEQAKHENIFKAIIDFAIGKTTVGLGYVSMGSGDLGASVQSGAIGTNNSNISEANSMKSEVANLTGVPGADASMAEGEENPSTKDPVTGETNEEDKTVKTASNDGTDDTDKMNTNIDEILKRKVRKGENISAEQA